MSSNNIIYAKVALPLKLKIDIHYLVPAPFRDQIVRGSLVKVLFNRKEYSALVLSLNQSCDSYKGKINPIIAPLPTLPFNEKYVKFLEWVSHYYMCTIGEVFSLSPKLLHLADKQPYTKQLMNLSSDLKPTLIESKTHFGKQEYFISMVNRVVESGGVALYIVPEVSLCNIIKSKMSNLTTGKIVVFHSSSTRLAREKASRMVMECNEGVVVIGTRSSLFLPFDRLDLIIVDDEHHSAHKQSDPAPRYNCRDSAVMLASLHKANIVLGSTYPSFESIYNYTSGRYNHIKIDESPAGISNPHIEVVDMVKQQKSGGVKGLFSVLLIREIERHLAEKRQIVVYHNRRSYASLLQCAECEDIPTCPQCNISLKYHKEAKLLQCHYCGYRLAYTNICSKCNTGQLIERGAGTQMVAEKLAELFPEAVIDRYDSDSTKRVTHERKIISDFASAKTDILVGTQMVGKVHLFNNLPLIIIVNGQTLFGTDDFRENEKGERLLNNLAEMTTPGEVRGKIIIQTYSPNHPVIQSFKNKKHTTYNLLNERKEFEYPPYTRLIKVSVRGSHTNTVANATSYLANTIKANSKLDILIAQPPIVERHRNSWDSSFHLKLPRDGNSVIKEKLLKLFYEAELRFKGVRIIANVDPL